MKRAKVFQALDWCVPCQQLHPVLEKLSADYPIDFIDIDTNTELAKENNVMKVPTVILYDEEGKEVKRLINPRPVPLTNEFKAHF